MYDNLPAPTSAQGTWCECGWHMVENVKKLCPVCEDIAHKAAADLDGAA